MMEEKQTLQQAQAMDRYWSLFIALVYNRPELSSEEAAQRAADYYREGTRVMREITE